MKCQGFRRDQRLHIKHDLLHIRNPYLWAFSYSLFLTKYYILEVVLKIHTPKNCIIHWIPSYKNVWHKSYQKIYIALLNKECLHHAVMKFSFYCVYCQITKMIISQESCIWFAICLSNRVCRLIFRFHTISTFWNLHQRNLTWNPNAYMGMKIF